MDSTPQEITTLVGREVYSNNGVYIGEVEDVRLDFDVERVTGLALAEVNRDLFREQVIDHRGVLIPYRWVQSIGDVILISDVVERVQTGADEEDEEAVV